MSQKTSQESQEILSLHEVEIEECGVVIDRHENREIKRCKVGDINYGISVESTQKIEVVFRNLESRLVDLILEAEVIFGCVAWLTNSAILKALAKRRVHIVIQKEDFIRPDSNSWSKSELHNLYDNLKPYFHRKVESIDPWNWDDVNEYQKLFEGMNVNLKYLHLIENQGDNFDAYLHPIRCVGGFNRDKKPAFPRMHNKFLIFF